MPLQTGKQGERCFVRWGTRGKKYFYTCGNREGRNRAKKKALKQARAIKANEKT